jgi:hypothetical protein
MTNSEDITRKVSNLAGQGAFLDKGNKSGLGEQSLSPAAQIQSHHAALKLQPVYKLKQTPARHAKQAKASVETRAAIFS